MKRLVITIGALVGLGMPVHANGFAQAMENYLQAEISLWASAPTIISAINTQNGTTNSYDQPMIDELDARWRTEVGAGSTPTITPVLNNEAAEFLRERVADAQGRITEIFIMDAQGLNVAASAVTSDYWQGDEAKFSETYAQGGGAVHIGEIELDESTGIYQGQISLTITDPATGQPIGAMTVGVDAQSLL